MRLNINLASRKYEEVRQFYVRWGIALAALTVLALLLATLAGLSYRRSAKSGQDIKQLQQKIAALEKERDRLVAVENQPANRDVTEQKKFWNSQIKRREFSWTQLFNDLQRIMPGRAHLVSVQPELTPDNRLKLKLIIEGESRANARELQERMENSERFRSPEIVSESADNKEAKPGVPSAVKFEIQTEYAADATHPSQPSHARTKGGM
jgi:Tfp pilus assembly protein PilN